MYHIKKTRENHHRMCPILSTKQTNKDETKGMNNNNEKKIRIPKPNEK